jgi:hypothetical protein
VAVTLGGFIAVRALIALLVRPHYISAVTVTYKLLGSYTPPASSWQIAQGVLGPNGQAVPAPNGAAVDNVPMSYLPASCATPTQATRSGLAPSCSQALAHFHGFVTYQPASRYWAFQGIEAGIFLALAAALIAVTAVVLLRRDA